MVDFVTIFVSFDRFSHLFIYFSLFIPFLHFIHGDLMQRDSRSFEPGPASEASAGRCFVSPLTGNRCCLWSIGTWAPPSTFSHAKPHSD